MKSTTGPPSVLSANSMPRLARRSCSSAAHSTSPPLAPPSKVCLSCNPSKLFYPIEAKGESRHEEYERRNLAKKAKSSRAAIFFGHLGRFSGARTVTLDLGGSHQARPVVTAASPRLFPSE